MLNITLRDESESDIETIFTLTEIAFTKPNRNPTEQLIVNGLREMGALMLSIVAELDEQIVGHVAFSPATITDGSEKWVALGPISVLPSYQRQGVGTALINEGLTRIQKLGAAGCLLLGNPDYYGRFGFHSFPGLFVKDVEPKYLQIFPFGDSRPQGELLFHPAFAMSH